MITASKPAVRRILGRSFRWIALAGCALALAVCGCVFAWRCLDARAQWKLSDRREAELSRTYFTMEWNTPYDLPNPPLPELSGEQHKMLVQVPGFFVAVQQFGALGPREGPWSKRTWFVLDLRLLYAVLLPVAGLLALFAWRARPKLPGTCVKCGYDLRASPDRCPECGHAVSPASTSTA